MIVIISKKIRSLICVQISLVLLLISSIYVFNNKDMDGNKNKVEKASSINVSSTDKKDDNIIQEDVQIEDHKNEDFLPDQQGILEIKSLDLESKIMQANDNKYYLSHNENNESDRKGCIYLDYRNNIDDHQLNIYGHNSDYYNLPFKKLEKFLNKDFYTKENIINIRLSDEVRTYKVFLIKIVNNNDNEHMKVKFSSEADFLKHLDKLRKNSLYDDMEKVSYDEQILVLQTCLYQPKDTYLLVVANRI